MMPAADVPFGAVLRAQRLRAGLTQEELSRRAGVSVRTLRDLERGRNRQPRPASLRRLAAAVGWDPAGLDVEGTNPLGARLPRPDPSRRKRATGSHGPSAERLELGVLGPLRVHRGNRAVVIGSRLQRRLLGVLALHPDRVVGREELVEVLWQEHPPRSWHSLIHTYVARLRRCLEPPVLHAPAGGGVIISAADGYRLIADSSHLDLLRFQELAGKAQAVQATDPAWALELLAEALGCWRDRVLADLPGVGDQDPAVAALTRQRTAAALAYADVALELGRSQQAAEQLGRLVHDEPLHEGVHARLMLALAGSGQQAAALEVFARLRGRLAGELGVEPGNELQAAQARVLRGDLPDSKPSHHRPAAAAAGPAAPLPLAQLPAEVAGFTGRAAALQQLDALLPGDGKQAPAGVLVTAIAGMAGVGKTALAVHWAHQVAGCFSDGQLHVNLRGHAQGPPLDPLQALAVLLAGLGVASERIPVELDAAAGLYRSLLADRRVLVVLDDARDAEQVRPLLPGSPTCVVVVTSRDRFTGLVATHGAHRLTLDVLAPHEAVTLLAQVIGADRVAAEPVAAARLARACGLLPLALRIAGAHLAGQPEQSITGYLAELQTGDRLDALAVHGDPRTAMRVAMDASYRHLSADARRLFRRLGLAPGPGVVSVEAAAALGGLRRDEARRLLELLLAAHLVEPRGTRRFGMHDLLRLYARERAEGEDGQPDRDAAFGRLLGWYLHAADAAARLLYPEALRLPVPPAEVPPAGFAGAAEAAAWLDAEQASLIAAVQHTAEHGPYSAAWRLADALREHLALRRFTGEWIGVARAGLAAATSVGDLRAQAACQLSLGQAQLVVGHYVPAIQCYTQAHALAGQAGWTHAQAAAFIDLGLARWWTGSLQQAADHDTQALTLSRQTGWVGGQATAHLYLGLVKRDMGRLEEAGDHHTQAWTLYRTLGSRRWEAYALDGLGIVEHELGRLDRAERHLIQALSLPWGVDDRDGRAIRMCALAEVHRDAGRLPQALKTAQAALILACEVGFRYTEAAARVVLASVQLRIGDAEEALDQAQKALELARASGLRRLEVDALLGLAAACQHTGQPAQAVSHARQALDIASQAGLQVLEGQTHTALAAAHHAVGHHDLARAHAEQALRLHRQTGYRLGQARSLHLLGLVVREVGSGHAAAGCWRQALALFADIGSPDADEIRGLLGA